MSNVDAAEIDKFSELAHRWWDPNTEFKPLHEINPLRLNYIDRLAALPARKCSTSAAAAASWPKPWPARGAKVTGIDLSEKAAQGRQAAPARIRASSVDYQLIAVEDLRRAARRRIRRRHLHGNARTRARSGFASSPPAPRLVKPGGWVFFSTLNRNPKSYLFAIIGAEYVLKLLPRGTHDYAKFIQPAELARMPREAGLDAEELIGMTYNPLTKVYKLEADTDVNYLMATRRGD